MADQVLKRWSSETALDPVKGNAQRRQIQEEEWLLGWLRLKGVTAQQLNQLLFLITSHSSPVTCSPYQQRSDQPVNSETLVFDGVTEVAQTEAPIVFGLYGSPLPDYSAYALPDHVWVIRKQ